MTETTSASQRPSVASPEAQRQRHKLLTAVILLALAVGVALLRLHRLNELPAGIAAGEGANGLDALRVLQGEHAVFFPEKYSGREGMVMYAIALSISLFGRSEFALRLPTALASAGTVFVVFWLGQVLFGRDEETGGTAPWRGLAVGGVAAGLMAVSLSLTIMGRTAYRTSLLPLFLCLCMVFLCQGWGRRGRDGSWWLLVLAGVCAGLLPYTYIPARLVPILLLFFGSSFLLPPRVVTLEIDGIASQLTGTTAALHRVRAEMPRIVVFVGVAVLVAAPILIHFALHPQHFFSRSTEVSLFETSHGWGNSLKALLVNVWDHLLVFGFRGDPNWRHTFAARPMLNPMEALFFWSGLCIALWRWQRRPSLRLLVLWLCLMILPALLASEGAPNTLRMIGAAPAVYLLIGVGLWESFRFLNELLMRNRRSMAALATGSVVSALIIVQGVITYRTYFEKWAPAPETYQAYIAYWGELAQNLDAQPSAANTVYLIPGYEWYSPLAWQDSFGFLHQGTTPTRLVSVNAPNLAPAVKSALAEMESISIVKFVDWDNAIVGGDDAADEQIAHLLGKYGRFQGSEDGPSFQIRTYTDISLDLPWTTYEQLDPLTVQYDGGISLYGFALGQGTEQLSSQQPYGLTQDDAIWVAMQWEIAPDLEIEYSISLRLHNAEGGVVYQQDSVLRDSTHSSTRRWSAGERVDTLHFLDFPADLALGQYEIRFVVYDIATLKPTVEIGVWEQETVLAPLRIEGIE